MIPKEKSEAVNLRRSDSTMANKYK